MMYDARQEPFGKDEGDAFFIHYPYSIHALAIHSLYTMHTLWLHYLS